MADYFTATNVPATSAALSSAVIRAEIALIAAGFAKVAAYTSSANSVVYINSGATAQTTTSGFTFDGTTLIVPALTVTNNATVTGNLAINGGSLTTTALTFNLVNAIATTLNVGGAATTIGIGAATGTVTVNNTTLAAKAITASTTLSVTGATTLSSTLTYGGVTLTNAVTGTGSMVLSASPTLTGTLTAAIVNFSGAVTLTSASPQLTLGVLNTTSGGILAYGSTSGSQTWKPPAAAGAGVTITFPAVTDTLATLGGTETLTNKTLTSPTLTTPVLGTPTSGNLVNCTGYTGTTALVTAGALTAASLSTGSGAISGGSLAINGAAGGSDQSSSRFAGISANGLGLMETDDASSGSFVVFRKGSAVRIGDISRVTTTDAVVYNTTSDATLKNIKGESDPLAATQRVMAYRMRDFEWKSSPGVSMVGPIAQEAYEVNKSVMLVTPGGERDGEYRPWTVNMSGFIPDLIMTAQSHESRLAALETQLKEMR